MEGDFSRGHRPDGKRGQRYRRVLVGQGTPLLDSDLAALVDAEEGLVREAVVHGAGDRGSPDLGYLVTPGELLALFDPVHGALVTASGGAAAVRDFSRRLLGVLPGLRVTGASGSVTVPLRRPLAAATPLRVWLRADGGATATVGGTAVAVPASLQYAAFDVAASGDSLLLEPDPAGSYWIAMVETRAPSGPKAGFHWAGGEYQVDGLVARTSGAQWPDLPGPAGSGLVDASSGTPGTRYCAYLELSERHVTGVEDPGLVEQALGGAQTASRSRLQAQVKLAPVAAGMDADAVASAVVSPNLPRGTVTLGVAATTVTAPPCDLPVPGGYTGTENRLYRFAVHSVKTSGGGETVFTWSRDNASELFPVAFGDRASAADPVDSLVVAAGLPLRDGDLVELLSESTDLGDSLPGQVGSAGFTRPVRSRGVLLRLSGGDQVDGVSRVFTFREPVTEAPIAGIDPAPFGTEGLKIRRWSGMVVRTGTGARTPDLERGIQAEIDGSFEPGSYWQYEARAGADNANGPAEPAPHGPERLFAPLALLEATAPGQPMTLLAWLDTRYRRVCDEVADAVTYDGDRAGTGSGTVQQALDELYLRVTQSCGELVVSEGASIQDVIDEIPPGGSARICLSAGARDLPAPVRVNGKGDLVLVGQGPGTLLRASARAAFSFTGCDSVTLRDLALDVRGSHGSVLSFADCGDVTVETVRITSRDRVAEGAAAVDCRDGRPGHRVTVRGNRMSLGHGDTGVFVLGPGQVFVRDNTIAVRDDPFDLLADVATAAGAAAVGNVLVNRLDFHSDDAFDFVAGPVVRIQTPGLSHQLTRRCFAFADGMWGRSVLTLTTDVRLSEGDWMRLVEANAAPSGRSTSAATMRGFVRKFRSRLARATLGADPLGPVMVPPTVRPALNTVAQLLLESNQVVWGLAGVVVAVPDAAVRGTRNRAVVSRLLPQGPRETITVADNHISGFRQGVRVGAGGRAHHERLVHSVDVTGNHIELRLPMQAYQRHGIFVGGALTARVVGNRVEDPAYDPTTLDRAAPPRAPVDCDGLRLWGQYGPLVQVRENLTYGVTVGVRYVNTARTPFDAGQVAVQNARAIDSNGYVGDGVGQVGAP